MPRETVGRFLFTPARTVYNTCTAKPDTAAVESVSVSSTIYLVIMVGIIALVTAVSVPSLFWKKCPACGKHNHLDAETCKACGAEFPEGEEES